MASSPARVNTSLGFAGGVGTTGVASAEIINTGTKTARIKKIRCWLLAATATQLGVGFPAAAGINPTAPVAFIDAIGRYTGLVKKAVAWGTPPTVPSVFLRVGDAAAAIGNMIEFDFGDGVWLLPNQTLVIWNRNTNSTLNISVEASENGITVA